MPGFIHSCEPIIMGACNDGPLEEKGMPLTSEPFHQFQVVFVCLFVCFCFKCVSENDKTCFEKGKETSPSK